MSFGWNVLTAKWGQRIEREKRKLYDQTPINNRSVIYIFSAGFETLWKMFLSLLKMKIN